MAQINIESKSHPIAVHDTGPADGLPLLLLHSLATDAEMWRPVVPALEAAGFRVIRPEMRGHGGTAATPGPYTIAGLAEDAVAVLDGLGLERVGVAGVSIGGLIGQQMAFATPERVSALALIDTALVLPPPTLWQERAATARASGLAGLVDGTLERWLTKNAPTDVKNAMRATFLKTAPEGYAACCEALAGVDLRKQSAGIRVPTLVIVGAEDPSTPVAAAEALRDTIPGAELEVIESAAHIPTAEQPAAVAGALLRFFRPDAFATGMRTRRQVLGDAHVDRASAGITELDRGFQRFITEGAWGSVWSGSQFDRRTRSIVTLALLAGLGREEEFALHVRATRNTGATPEDISELLMHVAVYAGVPAANSAMRIAKKILAEG